MNFLFYAEAFDDAIKCSRHHYEEKDNSAREKWCKQFPVQQKGDTRKNTVPKSLEEDILEKNVCKALSLTGINVTPEEIQPCNHFKKRNI